MPKEEFAIFSNNGHGILRRNCCEDVQEAMRVAQGITTSEGVESFIYDLRFYCKVATFLPDSLKSPAPHEVVSEF